MTRTTDLTLSIILLISCLLTSSPAEASWLGYLLTGRETVDASDHPFAQPVMGREIELLKTSFLVDCDNDCFTLFPPTQGFSFQPQSIEEYHVQVSENRVNPRVKGVVAEGTRLKISRVAFYRNRKLGFRVLEPYAVVQSGEFRGLEVDLSAILRAHLDIHDSMHLTERFAKFVDEEAPVEKEPHD